MYPARYVVIISYTPRLFERCGMPSCFVFHKQLNQNIIIISSLFRIRCITTIASKWKVLRENIVPKCCLKLMRIKNSLKTLSYHFDLYCRWKIPWMLVGRFLITIDDRLVGAIGLFQMIDCEISTDSLQQVTVIVALLNFSITNTLQYL